MGGSEISDSDNGDDKPTKAEGKIQRSLKSMLQQMQLSDNEMKYRMENFDNVDVVKEYLKYLKCTKCNMNFQKVINKGNAVGIHPLLGVLMCNSCCDYYGDGDFSLDSEGEDKYCRWCGEGGTIFACSKCICGFCDLCIKKHFGEKCLEEVKNDDDWICFFCNPQPLWYLRSICSLAKEAARNKRDHLKKSKEGSSVRKKKRKIDTVDNDSNKTSSDSSCSSSKSSDSNVKKQLKRKRLSRLAEKARRDHSSSSEDEKENHVNSKRKIGRSKKQLVEEDITKDSSGSDTKNVKKKAKIEEDEYENQKTLVLQKLKSIWRLTQTITEVGLSSSRDRLRQLSRLKYKTVEHLKKEHEDLKSCMDVLVSSLKTASNSVNSITDDLTFDTTNDETETFRSQEIKLKTFAEKFNDKTSDDFKGDSFLKEFKEKKGNKKKIGIAARKSLRRTVRKYRESDNNSEEEKNSESEKSVLSDSGSDEKKKNEGSKTKEENLSGGQGSCDSGIKSVPLKPLLKVKSFARMLNENVYDRNKSLKEKSPIVVDLYDIDTDESENENKKKGSPEGENKKADKTKVSDIKSSEDGPMKQEDCLNGEMKKTTSGKETNNQHISSTEFENFVEDSTKNKKTSSESDGETAKKKEETKKKSSSGSETEQSTIENGKSFNENNEDYSVNKFEVEKKQKCGNDDENKDKSSGNEEGQLDNEEKEENKQELSSNGNNEETSKRQSDGDKSRRSKGTTNGEGAEEKENNNENKKEKNFDKNDSSEEENNERKDSDSISTDNDEDCDEERKNKKSCKKSKKDIKNFDNENSEKGESSKITTDNEGQDKKDSSSSEREDTKKLCRKDKKSDSSDTDSKKSSEEQNKMRKTRRQKKEIKASFEVFKKKRERFLRSSKENSTKPETEKGKRNLTKALESSESESEKKSEKKRTRKKRILASSDEENGANAKEEKETTTSSEESEKENLKKDSDSEVKAKSESELSSEEELKNKKRKRLRKRQTGSSDSSEEENKKKKKRTKSSSESSGDDNTKKKKKGRKNIKKILKKDSLQVETKEALKNEEERKKRLKERQKLLEEIFPHEEEDGAPKQLILDFNPDTKEPVVTVHKKLVKKLKPHQINGVKFMWDNCFESVQKMEEESGSGCILAHCMGLGKTLQVITLVHTVMSHDLGVNTVLIVCPLSTVSNWIREFETWLANIRTEPITLYDLVKYKRREERLFHLKDWHENGGVLVLSYDLFRNLTKTPQKKNNKRKQKCPQIFERALLDPGPDLVVCDEGHLLKNEGTALSRCMNRVKTSRRIILTGTPLQNNLIEYHCMVQFVKPNILGTRKEFCNRFVNPINNGQFEDSTELDVKIMKRRSHVLHSMLEGCIQRFDYSVLTPFLPEKHEYVLSIGLTEKQAKAYTHFINNLSAKSYGSMRAASLFNDYHSLQRIWTHPRTLLMQSEKENQKENMERDSEGSLKDFVVSSSEESEKTGSESSDDQIQEIVPKKRILRSNANDLEAIKALEEEEWVQIKHWWDEFYDEKAYDDLRESNKLIILFSLLKYCKQKKDKILVFSQSLYSLDLIEYFLAKVDENNEKDDETLCGHKDSWILGTDYFRLDGSTNSETRAIWCKHFNKESNTRARLFLISTRAGGLGINLYGANRVVMFDASWNPSHDLQSIFRVYRFGQKKTCYIYRFLSEATMEEKIYERQVTKLSLAHRVVDEHQIERHYTMGNLQELYAFHPTPRDQRETPKLPKDSMLADILAEHRDIIVGYHEHDSLLENKQEEELNEEERKAAWKEYEEEKTQRSFNYNAAMEQMMLMQQGQFAQGGAAMQHMLNPAAMSQLNPGQNYVNPMFLQNVHPIETLQRGVRVGVTPLPNESTESYHMRIYNREAWMQARQIQGQGSAP